MFKAREAGSTASWVALDAAAPGSMRPEFNGRTAAFQDVASGDVGRSSLVPPGLVSKPERHAPSHFAAVFICRSASFSVCVHRNQRLDSRSTVVNKKRAEW